MPESAVFPRKLASHFWFADLCLIRIRIRFLPAKAKSYGSCGYVSTTLLNDIALHTG